MTSDLLRPRRLLCLSAVLAALAVNTLFSPAVAAPSLVVDARTGAVLHAEDATRPWNPASTTKMMTAYVALRAVQQGRLTLDTPFIASANAARQRPSKVGIRPGQEITLDNALKVLMVKSANDLAVVIAEGVAGSVDGFSQLMNAEARRLGMRESNFRNPHGFHADGHVTSARDLAVLARAMLLEMPEYQGYWGIGAVQLGNRVMKNTNGLIGRYPGAEGFKTGFVCASGFNVVATANRGGRTLIAVVMGAASGAERTVKAAQLLDKGFGDWGSSGSTLAALPESGYDSAPNMREDICRRGRSSVVLSDDSENDSAIFVNEAMRAGGMDSVNSAAFFLQQQGRGPGNAAGGVSGGSTSSGRPVLGPRADFAPIPVAFGRAAGSTAVAVGPTRPAFALATPAATPPAPSQPATAFAPANAAPTLPRQAATRAPAATVSAQPGNLPPGMEPARQPVTTIVERAPAAAPAPAPLTQASALRGVEAGEPLQLPGVFTAGSIAAGAAAPRAAGAASLRSRDAARPAERPRLGAIQNQPPARPAATPATPAARTAPKAAARANAPKATAPRVTAPKAAPANGGPRVVRPTAAATPASANPAAARPAAQPGT